MFAPADLLDAGIIYVLRKLIDTQQHDAKLVRTRETPRKGSLEHKEFAESYINDQLDELLSFLRRKKKINSN